MAKKHRAESREGLIIATQDQSLTTKSIHTRIMDGMNPHCRICGKYKETEDHIVSGCPELAKTEYIRQHKAVAYLH